MPESIDFELFACQALCCLKEYIQNCSALLLASLEALTLDWISESRAPSVLNNNNSLL